MYKINDSLVEQKIKKVASEGRSLLILLVVAILFFCISILNAFVFFKVQVSGKSMEDTLNNGDVLVVNKRLLANRGDIVIISGENNTELIVKRVIAMGGDTIKIVDGYVYLKKAGEQNFKFLDEKYLLKRGKTFWTVPYNAMEESIKKNQQLVVPDGCIFYLGDNRENSKDSRSEYGCCYQNQILGVVENWALSIRGIAGFFNRIFNFA